MENIIFTITLLSEKGKSIYKELPELTTKTLEYYIPSSDSLDETIKEIEKMNFTIEAQSAVGITCSCSKEYFEKVFKVKVEKKKLRGVREADYYINELLGEAVIPDNLKSIEKITLPRQLFVLDENIVPKLPYFHYNVPEDIRLLGHKEKIDNIDLPKKQCSIGIIDTGFYNHLFFKNNCFNITCVPAVSCLDSTKDERGHGTGMISVLASLSSEAKICMIKAADLETSFPVAALQKASQFKFDILNCSWGIIGYEPQAYLEIVNIVSSGTTVVFSCGNGSNDRKNLYSRQ